MATDPNIDFNQFVAESIKTEVSDQLGNQRPPEPLIFNVAGQQLKFNSKEEMEQALNQFVQGQAQQSAQYQNQIQELQSKVPIEQGSYVSGDDAPTWSDDAFIEKMTKAPKDAMEYALNQLIFDGKSENASNDLKQHIQEMELTKKSIAAYQFKEQHPEFPGGVDFANKIDQVRQQMNLPYDINGLEAAYLMGINKGVLPNFYQQHQQQNQQEQDQNQYQQQQPPQYQGGGAQQFMGDRQNPYLNAPPSVNRSAPASWQPNFDPESLSTEQIEAVFARAGKPVQGR